LFLELNWHVGLPIQFEEQTILLRTRATAFLGSYQVRAALRLRMSSVHLASFQRCVSHER